MLIPFVWYVLSSPWGSGSSCGSDQLSALTPEHQNPPHPSIVIHGPPSKRSDVEICPIKATRISEMTASYGPLRVPTRRGEIPARCDPRPHGTRPRSALGPRDSLVILVVGVNRVLVSGRAEEAGRDLERRRGVALRSRGPLGGGNWGSEQR